MSNKYWIMLDWKGAPLPSNPAHAGWTEIESFGFDQPPPCTITRSRPAPSEDTSGGDFRIGIRLSGPSTKLFAEVKPPRTFISIAVDFMTPEGKWQRYQFQNAYALILGAFNGVGSVKFMFERMDVKAITLHRKR